MVIIIMHELQSANTGFQFKSKISHVLTKKIKSGLTISNQGCLLHIAYEMDMNKILPCSSLLMIKVTMRIIKLCVNEEDIPIA